MNKLKFVTFAVIGILVILTTLRIRQNTVPVTNMLKSDITTADPPSIQMYFFIEKYAQEFDIPRNFAYGIAHCESRYNGPFDWDYNPYLTSPVGALGPMQLMPKTAKFINDNKVDVKRLKIDIEYNVRISMKFLRYLKNQYSDWKLVFGCYNTGSPLVNQYAMDVYTFKPNW